MSWKNKQKYLCGAVVFLLVAQCLPAEDVAGGTSAVTQPGVAASDPPKNIRLRPPIDYAADMRAAAGQSSAMATQPDSTRSVASSSDHRRTVLIVMIAVAAVGVGAGIWATHRGNGDSKSPAFGVTPGTPIVTGPR